MRMIRVRVAGPLEANFEADRSQKHHLRPSRTASYGGCLAKVLALATRGSLLSKATHKGTIPPTQVSAAGPQARASVLREGRKSAKYSPQRRRHLASPGETGRSFLVRGGQHAIRADSTPPPD